MSSVIIMQRVRREKKWTPTFLVGKITRVASPHSTEQYWSGVLLTYDGLRGFHHHSLRTVCTPITSCDDQLQLH
jgi:hypothetical protein